MGEGYNIVVRTDDAGDQDYRITSFADAQVHHCKWRYNFEKAVASGLKRWHGSGLGAFTDCQEIHCLADTLNFLKEPGWKGCTSLSRFTGVDV